VRYQTAPQPVAARQRRQQVETLPQTAAPTLNG
jgi:hypothetical protein